MTIVTFEEKGLQKNVNVTCNPPPKFIVRLKRKEGDDGYNGEFGFDWLRDAYIGYGTLYNELKEEYTSIPITCEIDYYVPWLSMFRGQDNVSLWLDCQSIGSEHVDADEYVVLPTTKGVSFTPNKITMDRMRGNDPVEIKIKCPEILSDDLLIHFKDKRNNVVGGIHFVKNDVVFEMTVKVVEVYRGSGEETEEEMFENADWSYIHEVKNNDKYDPETYLNKHSMQQAFITVKFDYIHDESRSQYELFIKPSSDICDEWGNVGGESPISELYDLFVKKYGEDKKHKGPIVFLTCLNNSTTVVEEVLEPVVSTVTKTTHTRGSARSIPFDGKGVVIYKIGLSKMQTYAHELSHILGCRHVFNEAHDAVDEKIKKYKEKVDDFDDKIKANKTSGERKDAEHNVNKFPGSASRQKVIDFNQELKNLESNRQNYRSLLEDFTGYKERNKFLFNNKGDSIDNFMDYCEPRNSFFKWQWEAMHYEIEKYHGLIAKFIDLRPFGLKKIEKPSLPSPHENIPKKTDMYNASDK